MTTQEPDSLHDLARLVAAAERFSSEGQMSLNKLVEATVYASIRRAGWLYRPLVTVDTVQVELDVGLHALRQVGLSPELMAALETGLTALAEHHQDDLLIEEAPTFTCAAPAGMRHLGRPLITIDSPFL